MSLDSKMINLVGLERIYIQAVDQVLNAAMLVEVNNGAVLENLDDFLNLSKKVTDTVITDIRRAAEHKEMKTGPKPKSVTDSEEFYV